MEKERTKLEIRLFLLRLSVMAVTFWLLFGVLFGVTSMKDDSMMPKAAAGDLVLYYRLDKQPEDRSLIVFRKGKKTYVSRVVARGGDRVEIRDDALYLNGSRMMETDIYYPTPAWEGTVEYPLTLEEDEVFVLSDYRERAKDSRYFGPVKRSEIKGTVLAVNRRTEL